MRPKPQEPNQVVLITRHGLEFRPFFRPTKALKQLAGYCLGLALAQTKAQINVAMITLDRMQVALSDRACDRSVVMQRFHSLFARCLNRRLDRSGAPLFGPRDHDGAEPLLDQEATLQAMAEVLAAPAELDLVESVKDWLGFRIGPEDWGKPLVFERPDDFFQKSMPESVTFTPMPPVGFEAMGQEALAAELERRVRDRELAAKMRREMRGKKVLGLKLIRRLTKDHLPKRPPKRSNCGLFRASSKEQFERTLAVWRRFWADHEAARRKMLLREPERDFCFPPQTYWWRYWSDAPCADPRQRQPFDPL